jgi:hypothetical protein
MGAALSRRLRGIIQMNELSSSIYSRLQTTGGLTSLLAGTTSIYHLQAPEGATLPYVVYSTQGGGDENLSQHRTKNLVVFVRAYSGSSAAQAGSIDAQIDAALHLNPLTVSGWTDFWLARETELETVQNEPSGRPVWMAGAMYRIKLDHN